MKHIKYILLIFFLSGFSSCKGDVKVNMKELESFFETSDIKTNKQGNVFSIVVNNSPFVESKIKDQDTTRQNELLALYCSMGALISATTINNSEGIDSIYCRINSSYASHRYKYFFKDLLQVRKNVEVVRSFIEDIKDGNQDSAQESISEKVLTTTPNEKIKALFATFTNPGAIQDSKLIGFTFTQGYAGMYVNVSYKNNSKQTFIFLFKTTGGKIEGIQLP